VIKSLQLSMKYQLPIINVAANRQMINEKLLLNAKCELVNTSEGGV
jgi:hypothetical protein